MLKWEVVRHSDGLRTGAAWFGLTKSINDEGLKKPR